MGSALLAAARAHAGMAYEEPTAENVGGTFAGRISSVRADGVYVVLPDFHPEREFGPCVLPIGLLGSGPAHADTTAGTAAARPVVQSNAVTLTKGYLVLVHVPSRGNPWLLAISPSGPGV